MTQPERLILDSLRECELCPAPGFYALKVNDLIFNYYHKHIKECEISLGDVDQDFSPIENRLQKLVQAFQKWDRER